MGPRLLHLLLLGTFTVVFMDNDEGIRFCHECDFFDGFKCRSKMKRCWKFNLFLPYNRSCTTEHYYYSNRVTGRYLFHLTKLSCKICQEGVTQVYHDLLKETHCCNDRSMCNTGKDNLERSVLYGEDADYTIHDDIQQEHLRGG
uniref:Uncharacterized protein n=1 Tax=Neovison vison TaxID=452646 RepID=A0A8C7BLB2_NEOVI